MSSGSVRAGTLAFTKIMFGCDAGIATAMKSRSASYPGSGYRLTFTTIADEVMSTVYPSDADFAAAAAPILPPAPARFSTTNCWPRVSLSFAPTILAMISTGPPGANGTMTRTGLFGQSCAWQTTAHAAHNAKTRTIVLMRSLLRWWWQYYHRPPLDRRLGVR